MFKYIISFFIFLLILFLYIHINFQLKVANDLEVYEIENIYKDKLEEICDIRQPVIFEITNNKIIENTNINYLMENYPMFEVKVRNIKEKNEDMEYYTPLTLKVANKLFSEDKESSFIIENNMDFLKETGAIKHIQFNDGLFRPNLVSNCNYDFISGSINSHTPFKYDVNYRNYFIVTQGSVTLKLAPPKSYKYLYINNDYENFEFRSRLNVWDIQPEYSADFEKIKCLEMVILPGKCVYIPAYWFYSFKFTDNSSITKCSYRTYMNNIAILPKIILSILQNHNINRNYLTNIINIDNNIS